MAISLGQLNPVPRMTTTTTTTTATVGNFSGFNGASLTNYFNESNQAPLYNQPFTYRRPFINLEAVLRFRLETPSTNPSISRSPERPTAGWGHGDRAMSMESSIRRNNWTVMKFSVLKRTRSANIFKTCMIMGNSYEGRVYKFVVDSAGIGTWFVGSYPVMIVDIHRSIIKSIMIPIPSIADNPNPGIVNLTRFLFRMLGLGAVRYKDHSLISTSNTSKKLAVGESWTFLKNEIGYYRNTAAQRQENFDDLRQRFRDIDSSTLPDIRGPRVRTVVEEIQLRENNYASYTRVPRYEGIIAEEWIPPTTFTHT